MSGRSRDTWSTLAVRPGADAHVTCHTYRQGSPILVVHGGPVDLSITPAARRDQEPLTARDVEFARQLVKAACTYLAEVERLHAQNAGAGTERAA
jgi:hypothetical protein